MMKTRAIPILGVAALWAAALLLGPLLLGALGAATETKHEKAARELGIEADDNGDYDPRNLDHLIFLHRNATEADKAQAAGFLETAHDRMLASPESFPMVAYFEALLAYPTAATLLGTANGFLRSARQAGRAAEAATRAQAGGLLRKAALYYGLTRDFAAATGARLHPKQHDDILYEIAQTEACIEARSPDPEAPDCAEVLDVSLPPTLIEMQFKDQR